jgi:hypothetical protein
MKFAREKLGMTDIFGRPNPYNNNNNKMIHHPDYAPFWTAVGNLAGVACKLHDRRGEWKDAYLSIYEPCFRNTANNTRVLRKGALDP